MLQPVDRQRSRIPEPTRTLHNIHIRPIRPDDWHRLQLFHQRLSDDTVALRFHAAKRELSTPLAHRFTELDGHVEVAMVAATGTRGRIVGVARYSRITSSCAEVAFVVEDAYQHRHIGYRLLRRLIQAARENGITEFVAEVLPGNMPAMRLLASAGMTRSTFEGGVCRVRVNLTPPGLDA